MTGTAGPSIWMLTPVAREHRDLFLSRLKVQVGECPEPDLLRIIAVLQSEDPREAHRLENDAREVCPSATVLHQAEAGVSRARNAALDHCLGEAAAHDFVVFRDCRSVLGGPFLGALSREPATTSVARTARIIWTEGAGQTKPGRASTRQHLDLLGRPTLAALAFRAETLADARFSEDIGPGETTRIKAGEDVLFQAQVFGARGDWRVRVLPGALFLMPRTDLEAKRILYASGQVHAARTLFLDRTLPAAVRSLAVMRLLFFIVGTLRFVRPGGGEILQARARALASLARPLNALVRGGGARDLPERGAARGKFPISS